MNAILIMCHKNLHQVERLVAQCSSSQTQIIIHIDHKACVETADIERLQTKWGVFFTDTRLSGSLDDRSLVDIAMVMVKKAKKIEREKNVHFQYYLLFSGQDYLTRPIAYINDQLQKSYPVPFIDCTPYGTDNWIYHKFCSREDLRRYDAWVSRRFPVPGMFLRRCARLLGRIGGKLAKVFCQTDYHMLTRRGIQLYGGSAWWILPDQAIDYILGELEKEDYVEQLLQTFTPEETFFQTMVMRSPVRELVQVNPIDMVEQNCKTFAYFSGPGKPFTGHPHIITKDDYEMLINMDCWIARKFDITIDDQIFDLLDIYISQYPSQ